jgi:hypothetical protein
MVKESKTDSPAWGNKHKDKRKGKKMNKPSEYGMVVYDIPSNCQNLYMRIWKRIRKYAIRINLSVYLIPWGNRLFLQNIIEEAEAATGQKATFSIMKYDVDSKADVEVLAREQLNREITDTIKRLEVKALECLEEGKDLPKAYLNEVQDRLDAAKSLSVIFGLVEDIDLAMNAALQVFNAHYDVCQQKIAQEKAGRKERKRVMKERAQEQTESMVEGKTLPTETALCPDPETMIPELAVSEPVKALPELKDIMVDTLVPPVTRTVTASQGSIAPAGLEQFIRAVTQQTQQA